MGLFRATPMDSGIFKTGQKTGRGANMGRGGQSTPTAGRIKKSIGAFFDKRLRPCYIGSVKQAGCFPLAAGPRRYRSRLVNHEGTFHFTQCLDLCVAEATVRELENMVRSWYRMEQLALREEFEARCARFPWEAEIPWASKPAWELTLDEFIFGRRIVLPSVTGPGIITPADPIASGLSRRVLRRVSCRRLLRHDSRTRFQERIRHDKF